MPTHHIQGDNLLHFIRLDLAHSDTGTHTVGTIPADAYILGMEIYVSETFDGGGAKINMGPVGDLSGMYTISDVDLTVVGRNFPPGQNFHYTADTEVQAVFDEGTSPTQGVLQIIIFYGNKN